MAQNSSQIQVLVTGASRGIGRAIARQLAARGCRVAVHYRANRAAADQVLADLPGERHQAFAADLREPHGAETLWRSVTKQFGHIDVLVNDAGIFEPHPPLTTDPTSWQETWERTLATNLLAPAHLCYLASRAMASAKASREGNFGAGRVVNISSRGAFRGEPNAPAYGASKAGLNALGQSLARALAGSGVYVYTVAPGWVDTDMAADHLHGSAGADLLAQHPLGRVATADEIATTAVFCALDAPSTMTGAIIDVNGASYLRT